MIITVSIEYPTYHLNVFQRLSWLQFPGIVDSGNLLTLVPVPGSICHLWDQIRIHRCARLLSLVSHLSSGRKKLEKWPHLEQSTSLLRLRFWVTFKLELTVLQRIQMAKIKSRTYLAWVMTFWMIHPAGRCTGVFKASRCSDVIRYHGHRNHPGVSASQGMEG